VEDDRIRRLIAEMLETIYAAPGIGLAATQVDVHEQVIVIDQSEEKNEPLVFINPQLKILGDETLEYDEGCLSVPGFYEPVCRPTHVRVKALDGEGKSFTIEPEGLLAICIQHEIDHLQGKLYVDYLSPLKRGRIKKKLQKQQRASA
jgi:peptide deformylase